jgi:hypothetical protein
MTCARAIFAAATLAALFSLNHAGAENTGTAAAATAEVALTVLSPSGERQLSVAEIESLGLRRVTTRSPWEAGTLTFEGVLLRDLLRHLGLERADSLTVTASDDYTQVIPNEDWANWPLLVATRQDGKPLTRRTQGPTRLVYPLSDHPELDSPVHKPRWVWAISSMEARFN